MGYGFQGQGQVSLWRIATDTPQSTTEDMAGRGAAYKGARCNDVGEHGAATSISLAAREARAHFGKGATLPWNRYLVRVDVPDDVWAAREMLPRPPVVGWHAIPKGLVSGAAGSTRLGAGRS